MVLRASAPNEPGGHESGQIWREVSLSLTDVSAAASAIATVVAAGVAVATFVAQRRKPSRTSGTAYAWLRRATLPLSFGIVAGLIVLLIASLWSPGPIVSLTSPASGAEVSRTEVFNVEGTASHLGDHTIWLTDYDGGYSVDDEATVKTNGTWIASDSQVGNPDQTLPFPLIVRVILADTQCATKLQEAMASNEDYLTELPGGCTVAGDVTVRVTTP